MLQKKQTVLNNLKGHIEKVFVGLAAAWVIALAVLALLGWRPGEVSPTEVYSNSGVENASGAYHNLEDVREEVAKFASSLAPKPITFYMDLIMRNPFVKCEVGKEEVVSPTPGPEQPTEPKVSPRRPKWEYTGHVDVGGTIYVSFVDNTAGTTYILKKGQVSEDGKYKVLDVTEDKVIILVLDTGERVTLERQEG